jgi:dihydrofolate synthase/folylpolyglutamate synthase
MRYEDALAQIHARLRFGNKLTLTRIKELLHLLGDPHRSLSVVLVAGTNGKGSVSKYIYYSLMAQGYRVGLYTSPYIVDFRERIECDGAWISPEALAECTYRVLGAAAVMESTGSDAPTEFEVVMAVAFLYFKECGCDYVVLEVGLGGRGDATNVIDSPLLSVITSISYDHMEYLGDTLPEIASEKAGIIKPGRPVVCRVRDRAAMDEIRSKALACDSQLYDVLEEVTDLEIREMTLSGNRFSLKVMNEEYRDLSVSLAGRYQIDNASTALCALEVLRKKCGVALEKRAIIEGMAAARHAARLEKICDDPLIIIDGAHNAEGMEAFCESVGPFIRGRRTLLTLGILKDKELIKMLSSALALGVDLALSEPENTRKATAGELGQVLGELGGEAVILGDASHAYAYALQHRKEYDCLLFAGSLYFVSAIREYCINGKESI